MFSYTCKICGEIISHEKDPYAIRAMIQHLGEKHQISKKDYIITYERNGDIPLCACGCGNPVEIAKGWNKWNKYYADHKNFTKASKESIEKSKLTHQQKLINGDFDDIPISILGQALDDLKKGKSLIDIELIYGFDKRTIKRNWLSRQMISKEDLDDLCLVTKYSGPRKRALRKKISNSFLEEIHKFIMDHKYEHTINDVNKLFGNKVNITSLTKCLKNEFGDEIFNYLLFGVKSKEELEYLDILSHFFGKKNVKYGYSLGDRIFDALVFNNILIEYDGSYYHSSEKSKLNDLYKTKLANQHGYKLIRVDEHTSKSIYPLIKILIWKNIISLKLKISKILEKAKNWFMTLV